MNLSFRIKLFILFIAIILFTTIPIGIIIYNSVYNSLEKNIFYTSGTDMAHIDNEIENIIKQKKEDTEFMAADPKVTAADESILSVSKAGDTKGSPGSLHNEIFQIFERYGSTHPEVQYVYMGTKWGGYVQWPDGAPTIGYDYDPRLRPWYKNAIENSDSVVLTNPYISSDESKSIIISTSSTMRGHSGDIVGVVSMDINLNQLSSMVNSVKIGNNGYVFLFDKDGTLITHPKGIFLFKKLADLYTEGTKGKNSSDKFTIDDYKKLLDKDTKTFETQINGSPVLINVYTSASTGWKMASVIQKNELLLQANKIGVTIIVITLIIIGLSVLMVDKATKRLTKPLTAMTGLMQLAGNGNLSVKSNITSKDEFGQLGRSFNSMMDKLYATYEELTAVHEELIATDDELRIQFDELHHKEEELKLSEERYRLALDGSNDAIWEWNLQNQDFTGSDKWLQVVGNPLMDKLSLQWLINNALHPDDAQNAAKNLDAHLSGNSDFFNAEFRVKLAGGGYKWLYCRGKALMDSEGNPIKMAGSITDISLRKSAEEKILHMAFYDSLTDLPNRSLFMRDLDEELQRVPLNKVKGSVLFIDLDNFKYINDTLGHDYGDKLLQILAEKLKLLKKSYDTLCRFGGDEFVVLHPFTESYDIISYAEEFLNLFNDSFEVNGKQIYVTASIGIALYPRDGMDANTALKNADTAMYKAKELGKSTYAIFDNEMYLKLERKTLLEGALRTALTNKEFSLHYQPQFNITTMKISGLEALLRLNSSKLGFVSPAEFIPAAEKSRLIVEIGEMVFREACSKAVAWQKRGFDIGYVGINLSTVQIQQPDFINIVKGIIEDTGINPGNIEVEITETALMQSLDANVKVLNELRNMGIKIALDDFGTGYSSLNYLRHIPINTLKIDKSFIDDICTGNKEEAIIESIIQMAHSMELTVVAEGVETDLQLSLLKDKQCDRLQGYLMSRPLPVSDIENLYVNQKLNVAVAQQ